MNESLPDPRQARSFRFVRCSLEQGVARLVYAFDDGPELVEEITFPGAPQPNAQRAPAIRAALELLHLIAGVSYYKAGVPPHIAVESTGLDAPTAAFLHDVYTHGLAEFAYRNQLQLQGRVHFSHAGAPRLGTDVDLPGSALVAIGGGKDSLVSIELLKQAGLPATVAWVGSSALIERCAGRTGLPQLNIGRRIAPELFVYNQAGAWNGHIPVTAINSAILTLAALLYGHDKVIFSNERSASAATLHHQGEAVNHQWSKGWKFEQDFCALLQRQVSPQLQYFSLLRPMSELAVTRRFAQLSGYDDVFSSCNRNFRLLGPAPADRWCGSCPKCHFVFLALAPFMPKPRLLRIFGRNLLDDAAHQRAFAALMEIDDHKPFECVGEAGESRAAMAALTQRAEWREDAVVAHFITDIAPRLAGVDLSLDTQLQLGTEHQLPAALLDLLRTGD